MIRDSKYGGGEERGLDLSVQKYRTQIATYTHATNSISDHRCSQWPEEAKEHGSKDAETSTFLLILSVTHFAGGLLFRTAIHFSRMMILLLMLQDG